MLFRKSKHTLVTYKSHVVAENYAALYYYACAQLGDSKLDVSVVALTKTKARSLGALRGVCVKFKSVATPRKVFNVCILPKFYQSTANNFGSYVTTLQDTQKRMHSVQITDTGGHDVLHLWTEFTAQLLNAPKYQAGPLLIT